MFTAESPVPMRFWKHDAPEGAIRCWPDRLCSCEPVRLQRTCLVGLRWSGSTAAKCVPKQRAVRVLGILRSGCRRARSRRSRRHTDRCPTDLRCLRRPPVSASGRHADHQCLRSSKPSQRFAISTPNRRQKQDKPSEVPDSAAGVYRGLWSIERPSSAGCRRMACLHRARRKMPGRTQLIIDRRRDRADA